MDGFTYALDSQGEITRVTYQDGAYWNYAYDGRYRLTSALRKNSGGTTLQAHAYVYDAGDNLVSKTVAGTGKGETQRSRRSGEGVSSRCKGVLCALGVLARAFSGRRRPPAEPQSCGGSVDEYRLRVGACRVLYTVDGTMRSVEIVAVGHRREVYRDT